MQQKVIAIGGANWDIKARSLGVFAPGVSNPGVITSAAGGVARNIAENLARLGIDVALLSAIGTDAIGDQLLDRTKSAGVDVAGVARIAGTTGAYLAVLDEAGEMRAAINDMQAIDSVTPAVLAGHEDAIRAAAIGRNSLKVRRQPTSWRLVWQELVVVPRIIWYGLSAIWVLTIALQLSSPSIRSKFPPQNSGSVRDIRNAWTLHRELLRKEFDGSSRGNFRESKRTLPPAGWLRRDSAPTPYHLPRDDSHPLLSTLPSGTPLVFPKS